MNDIRNKIKEMREDLEGFEEKWLYVMNNEREQYRNDLRVQKQIIANLSNKIKELEEEKELFRNELRRLRPIKPIYA